MLGALVLARLVTLGRRAPRGDRMRVALAGLASPPPCGWSTGFMATPRTVGLMPRQRLAPALPSFSGCARRCRLRRSWRGSRRAPCASRRSAGAAWRSRLRGRAAARRRRRRARSGAPLPGFISMQCTVEPTGMLRSGRVLPALDRRSRRRDCSWSPVCQALRRDDVAALAVGVAQQRDVRACGSGRIRCARPARRCRPCRA